MNIIFKMIKCLLVGHISKEIKDYYGTLTNGMKTYEISYGACVRCGKKNKYPSRPL